MISNLMFLKEVWIQNSFVLVIYPLSYLYSNYKLNNEISSLEYLDTSSQKFNLKK